MKLTRAQRQNCYRYVKSLKRKANDLDLHVRQLRARLSKEDLSASPLHGSTQQVLHVEDTAGAGHTPSVATSYSLTATESSIPKQSVQAAMGQIGSLSRNAMAEPLDDETGSFPKELAMINILKGALRIAGDNPTQSIYPSLPRRGEKLLAFLSHVDTFNEEAATPYLDHFRRRIAVMFPHLDSNSRNVNLTPEPNDNGRLDSDAAFKNFNNHMELAGGLILSEEPSMELFASKVHTLAVSKLDIILQEGDEVKIIHCILSLIIHSLFTSTGGSSWHLIGYAMAKCITFQFHKEPQHHVAVSSYQKDRRKCLFWSLYILDRFVILALARILINYLTQLQDCMLCHGQAIQYTRRRYLGPGEDAF